MDLIRLDLTKTLDYNEPNKRFIRWLKFMNAKSMEELKKISKGDEMMEKTLNYVEWYLNSENNRSFEDMISEKEEQAKKNSLIKTAKNMLNDRVDIKQISKYTGLSIREIKKLKSE